MGTHLFFSLPADLSNVEYRVLVLCCQAIGRTNLLQKRKKVKILRFFRKKIGFFIKFSIIFELIDKK